MGGQCGYGTGIVWLARMVCGVHRDSNAVGAASEESGGNGRDHASKRAGRDLASGKTSKSGAHGLIRRVICVGWWVGNGKAAKWGGGWGGLAGRSEVGRVGSYVCGNGAVQPTQLAPRACQPLHRQRNMQGPQGREALTPLWAQVLGGPATLLTHLLLTCMMVSLQARPSWRAIRCARRRWPACPSGPPSPRQCWTKPWRRWG